MSAKIEYRLSGPVGIFRDAADTFAAAMLAEKVIYGHATVGETDRGVFALADGQVVGMATFNRYGSAYEATVSLVYVMQPFRKCGIAGAMLAQVEEVLASEGIVRLFVKPTNWSMQSVLEREGYDTSDHHTKLLVGRRSHEARE